MKKILLSLAMLFSVSLINAQEIDSTQMFIDSVESQLQYREGSIELSNGIGTLQIPSNFRFLDDKQAQFVLQSLWGNPEDTSVLGMIVPKSTGVMADNSWAFIVTYDEMGYVKDDDAGDIDYDELLEEMQNDTKTANEQREQLGYQPITLIGWASKPFYDSEKKVLHWAKELKFGEDENNTLNYNVRILGRKGVLVLNAVALMGSLGEVQENITPVLSSFSYADGNKYDEFNPDIDEVAAWTVGGLVAGKVLTKVGFFAIILKYIKFIGLAIAGLFGAAWKWWKRKTEAPTVRNISDSNPS